MKNFIFLLIGIWLTGCSSIKSSASNNKGADGYVTTTVSCTGETFEKARYSCFRNAIEQAVGIAFTSSKEVLNNDQVKSELLNYSAGYVTSYDILKMTNAGNQVSLNMVVKVSSSQIQDRILGKFSTTEHINGENHATKYDTYLKTAQDGDQFLSGVLNDYPARAFEIEIIGKDHKLDPQRNSVITVYYELKWNQRYLTALNETLRLTSDKKSKQIKQHNIEVQSNSGFGFFGSSDVYYLNDDIRANLIKDTFVGKITVTAHLLNENNKDLAVACAQSIVPLGLFNDTTYGKFSPYVIRGTEKYEGVVKIKIKNTNQDLIKLSRANNIKMSLQKGECYNFKN